MILQKNNDLLNLFSILKRQHKGIIWEMRNEKLIDLN